MKGIKHMEDMNAMDLRIISARGLSANRKKAPMSPEVYERAVSVIGTVVPLLLFGCGIFALLLLCFKLFGGGRRGR